MPQAMSGCRGSRSRREPCWPTLRTLGGHARPRCRSHTVGLKKCCALEHLLNVNFFGFYKILCSGTEVNTGAEQSALTRLSALRALSGARSAARPQARPALLVSEPVAASSRSSSWASLPWQCSRLSEPPPPGWDCPEGRSVPGAGVGGQGARPAAGPQVQRPRRCLVTVGGGLPGEEEGGGEHPEEKLRLDLGLVESAGERAPQVSARSAPHPAGRGPPPPSLPQPSPAGSSCCGARGARPRSACATPAS